MNVTGSPRIAVVHEWLLDYAGSERVLRAILEVFPQADLFALVDQPDEELRAASPRRARATTFLRYLPAPRRLLRWTVPLMPLAIERLDLSGYQIVISSSHVVAKGVLTRPSQLHLSYVHTPMRFAWDLQQEYLRAAGLERGPLSWAARLVLDRLRRWDARTAKRVDVFVANSAHVARRIRKAYGRDAEVLHPPVDVAALTLQDRKEDFYLTVSRLEAYKRTDLLVDAFRAMPDRRLVVVGDGPERRRLSSAAPPNVTFRGRLPTPEVHSHMRRARAFLFAGIEDFGIVMAEAQACGTPVIAFAEGGALDIVRGEDSRQPTGLLFPDQTPEAVAGAVRRFESKLEQYAPAACRENAMRFDRDLFKQRFKALVQAHWERFSRESSAVCNSQEQVRKDP
jgi:glycosyltransferase involved in cell wall biosynthesis